jgi:hypothetical protein
MDRMFIVMILTLAVNDQGRMLIGQFLNLMTLPAGALCQNLVRFYLTK